MPLDKKGDKRKGGRYGRTNEYLADYFGFYQFIDCD